MDRKRTDLELSLENGLVLRTLGWMLLIFNGVFVVWVWTALRAGSDFWLWWVLIQGGAGVILLGVGSYKRLHSARLFLSEPVGPAELTEPAEAFTPDDIDEIEKRRRAA
jgi:hypothetical protein